MNNFKFAIRMLLKAPAFSVIAIATLALGIGANSAIFSVVDAMLLRPLPFKDPDRIVAVWAKAQDRARDVFSYADYVDLRDQNRTFSALAAYTRTGGTLTYADESQLLEGVAISPQVFDVLGVAPLIGRTFTEADNNENVPRVIVITHQLWQRAFGGESSIVGKEVTLSGRNHTIVGVMPPGWKFPVEDKRIDYVIPIGYFPASVLNRNSQFLSIVGKLKPGVSLKQAEADASAIMHTLATETAPDTNAKRFAATVINLHSDVTREVRPALLILLGAVVLVLLIACANVANLLLARAAARSREIAIRTALGASRGQLVRQLLCESLLIALIGGGAGLLLASWSVDLLHSLGTIGLPYLGEIRVNFSVGFFTFALAVGSTLLFGLLPALQVSRGDVNDALQHGNKGTAGGLHSNRARAFLVVSQVSLSLLLLAGAGLLIKSFFNLRATDPGFDTQRVVTASLTLPRVRYPEAQQQIRTHEKILETIAAIPGVEVAADATTLPLSENHRTSAFTIAGAPPVPQGNRPTATYFAISPDYFQAMGIPLRAGRFFTRADNETSPVVVIVNEAFSRKYFPERDAVGQRVILSDEGKPVPCEVVGVVANTKDRALSEEIVPQFFAPFPQDPGRSVELVVRTAVPNLSGLSAAVRSAVREVDKDLFVPNLEPVSAFIGNQLAQPRFNMILLAAFAAVAMALAAIGIYGVIAYSVAQRTREIGIRMALGAQRTQMLQMILRQSLTLVTIGLTSGFVVALATTRVMRTLLYGVGVNDFSTYAIVFFLLGGAALLASYIPARRAMNVDPMVALRYE